MKEIIWEIFNNKYNKEGKITNLEEIKLDAEHGFSSLVVVEFLIEVADRTEIEIVLLLEKYMESKSLADFAGMIE